MRILVTGSAGRIGRSIYIRLSRLHEVRGLDLTPSSTTDLVGAFGDPTVLARALEDVDAIVHVAALHAPHVPYVKESEFQRVNVDDTCRLIDACTARGIRRLVFTSTTALYGHASKRPGRAAWISEDTPPEPITVYHRTKLAAEAHLRSAAGNAGLTVRIMRMSRCFPEPANVMAAFRLHRGIDARDVASAHELALVHDGDACETFVLSGSTPFRRDDCQLLWQDAPAALRLRCPRLVEDFSARGWTAPASIDRVYSSTRAIERLGWRPRHDYTSVMSALDAESSEVLQPSNSADWRED